LPDTSAGKAPSFSSPPSQFPFFSLTDETRNLEIWRLKNYFPFSFCPRAFTVGFVLFFRISRSSSRTPSGRWPQSSYGGEPFSLLAGSPFRRPFVFSRKCRLELEFAAPATSPFLCGRPAPFFQVRSRGDTHYCVPPPDPPRGNPPAPLLSFRTPPPTPGRALSTTLSPVPLPQTPTSIAICSSRFDLFVQGCGGSAPDDELVCLFPFSPPGRPSQVRHLDKDRYLSPLFPSSLPRSFHPPAARTSRRTAAMPRS